MPKVSRESAAQVDDYGMAEDHHEDVDGYTFNFVTIRQTHDLAPMLKGLPGDSCPCPHWGYVIKGRVTVRYADHEELLEAGDAYYFPPGHVPAAEAGTELLQISPARELAEVEAAIRRNMQAAQGG